MQCILVGYRGICHASLVFSVYTRAFRQAIVYTKKIRVTSGIFHGIPWESIAQLLYPMPKSSENLREFPKISETLQTRYWGTFIRKIYENFGKSLAIFGNFWKTSETVQKCFPMFLWFFKTFGKSSEIFGSVRKSSKNFRTWSKMFVMVRRSWRVSEQAFEKSSNGPQ